MKIIKSTLLICLILLNYLNLSCQAINTQISNDPAKYIANMLNDKKVIMLGDSYHSHPLYFYTVIDIMNEWLNIAKNNPYDKHKLTLILEHGNDFCEALNSANNISDLQDIVNKVAVGINQEDLEFYSKILEFKSELRNIKSTYSTGIEFKIKGFEINSFYENFSDSIIIKSEYEQDLWFLNKRDSIVSSKVVEYIKNYPDDNILMYYGSAHLIKNYTNKSMFTYVIKDDKSMGYYDAYYLKKNLGDKKVLTVLQMHNAYNFGQLLDTTGIKNDILIKYDKPDPKDSLLSSMNFILRKSKTIFGSPHPVNLLFCKNNLTNIVKYLNYMRKYNSSGVANIIVNRVRKYLEYVTGYSDYKKQDSLNYSNIINGYNGFSRLNSDLFTKQIYNNFYNKYREDKEYRRILYQIGFDARIQNTTNLPDTSNWKDTLWPKIYSSIKYFNSVGILWVGNDEEKIQAKKYLQNITGNDYSEIYKYLIWYREKVYNLNY